MYFAAIDMNELSILVGAFFAGLVAIMGVFFKFMQWREKETQKERTQAQSAFDKTITLLATNIKKNTEQAEKQTEVLERTADEAKARNGHLAELALEGQKSAQDHNLKLIEIADRNYNAIKNISNVTEQHVEHQVVQHEIVKDQQVKGGN